MSEEHLIRLRGPWRAEYNDQANPDRHGFVDIQVQSGNDWLSWMPLQFSGKVTFVRRFHWTFPQPSPDIVQLLITELRERPVIRINDRSVGFSIDDSADDLAVDVLSQLTTDNELKIEFPCLDRQAGLPPMAEVFLQIS